MLKKDAFFKTVVGVIVAGGLFFLLTDKDVSAPKQKIATEKTQAKAVLKRKAEFSAKTLAKPRPKREVAGHLLATPVGYLEAATECLGQDFEDETPFLSILGDVGLIHSGNQTLRRNRIYEDRGQEVRVSMARASDSEIWEAKVFTVDSQGYPLFLEKKSDPEMEPLVQFFNKSFAEAPVLQAEEFLSVRNTEGAGGTVLLVNNVPVEVNVRVPYGDAHRSLECGAGRCSCYESADL